MHGREIGNYQITNFLGRGRNGEVFRAVRRDDPRQRVALKAIYPNGTGSEALAAELEPLVAKLKQLEHRNVLGYHDLLVADDACFLVMDYANASPLGQVVGTLHNIYPVPHALGLFQQTVAAVAHAHSKGLVHGGLSGQQVLVTVSKKLKVTDFGLESIVGSQNGDGAAAEPAYVAPELRAGDRLADARSDVYSLGIFLFHLLVGHPPEIEGDAEPIAGQLREARSDLPSFVVSLVERATAGEPDERPKAGELSEMVTSEHFAAGAPVVQIGRRNRSAATTETPKEAVGPEPEMVLVPAGPFVLGSEFGLNEQPMTTVELPDFEIGKYPVTNAVFRAYCDASGTEYPRDPEGWEGYFTGHPNHPVIHVDWQEAVTYCEWLAETTGKPYRLPTEQEWEKAAKGGLEGKRYPWGDEEPDGRALYAGRAHAWQAFQEKIQTCAVGSYPANGYGLHDMAGLVWEWTADWYIRYDAEEKQRKRPGIYRVVRGGSWGSDADCVRSSYRMSFSPDYRDYFIGFRCVCSKVD